MVRVPEQLAQERNNCGAAPLTPALSPGGAREIDTRENSWRPDGAALLIVLLSYEVPNWPTEGQLGLLLSGLWAAIPIGFLPYELLLQLAHGGPNAVWNGEPHGKNR
jgi:hypothetical protein